MTPKERKCDVPDCVRPHVARGYCRLHYRRFMTYGDVFISRAPAPVVLGDTKRTCTRCDEEKPIEGFGKNIRYRDKRQRICKRCMSKNSLEWHHANKERSLQNQRVARVRRIYGPDGLKVEARRRAGDGCDICGNKTARMSIDHCHESGKIRGLLCKDCNLILGWVKDDIKRLQAMVDYLEAGASQLLSWSAP